MEIRSTTLKRFVLTPTFYLTISSQLQPFKTTIHLTPLFSSKDPTLRSSLMHNIWAFVNQLLKWKLK